MVCGRHTVLRWSGVYVDLSLICGTDISLLSLVYHVSAARACVCIGEGVIFWHEIFLQGLMRSLVRPNSVSQVLVD